MIVKEFYMKREDGINLYITYSDENYYIRQIETGAIYSEAIDVENSSYTYEETDKLIEKENLEVEE
jgi:ubiquinone biosynthesis protein COQ9